VSVPATEGAAPPTPEGASNPFASRTFRRWWAASLVAGTGVGIQSVTVPLYIRDRVALDDRGLAISAALIATSLPGACLALFGGAIADRVEQRRILLRSYAVAAAVSIVYVWLVTSGSREIWPVFFLAAVVGGAGGFTNPARQSMLPQLVGRGALQNGVIFGTMGFMATLQFIGPSIGGILTDLYGLAAAFSSEVLLLLAGGALFQTVRTVPPPASGRNVAGDLMDGLRYVRGQPALMGVLSMAVIPGVFFIGPFAVTVPIVVPDFFAAPDRWVGFFWGCFGGGVLVGSIVLTLRPIARRGLALCASSLAGGLVLLLYGSSTRLEVSAGLLFVWGLGASVFINYAVALLQHHTAPHMIGRVMSMYTMMFLAASPLGYFQAGAVTDAFGPRATLLSSGAVAACVGLAALLFLRPVRELD
jgi:predicted MFS family arabinose efflux permease